MSGFQPRNLERSGRPESSKVFITRVGLKITADLSFEDWKDAGHRLSGMLDSSSWCLGDWLAYGIRRYGHRYQQALNTTGLQYQTLRNYFWVAHQFPVERRHPRLTFQHHAEVASLPPQAQDALLARAERLRWTTKQLRAQVRKERVGASGSAVDFVVIPRIRVPGSQLERWRFAASKADIEFDQWLIATLDQAAQAWTDRASA